MPNIVIDSDLLEYLLAGVKAYYTEVAMPDWQRRQWQAHYRRGEALLPDDYDPYRDDYGRAPIDSDDL